MLTFSFIGEFLEMIKQLSRVVIEEEEPLIVLEIVDIVQKYRAKTCKRNG